MKKLLFAVASIFLIISCEKEEKGQNNKIYYPLNIGNYWVYQNYEVDSSGNVTEYNGIDSVIIKRDTVINGNQYYILEGEYYPSFSNWGIVDILRDSTGYIVNNKGQIKFSKDNFTDILATKMQTVDEDTLFILNYKMERCKEIIDVPAGNFDVLNFKGTLDLYYNYEDSTEIITKYQNTYFSKDVGKILDTYNWYSQKYKHYEKRLIRYHVNNPSE